MLAEAGLAGRVVVRAGPVCSVLVWTAPPGVARIRVGAGSFVHGPIIAPYQPPGYPGKP